MTLEEKIRRLADKTSDDLRKRINSRLAEVESDDAAHYVVYRALGIGFEEGRRMDIEQNQARFLAAFAGGFLEDAVKLCLLEKFPDAGTVRIRNKLRPYPKAHEVDLLVGRDAIDVRFSDVATDRDYLTNEQTRLRNIVAAGYKPIRLTFYFPNQERAIRIQRDLEALYRQLSGEYHWGPSAWRYVRALTGIHLEELLKKIAAERFPDA